MSKFTTAKPTHIKTPTNDYSLKLQSPQWQKIRLKIFERAGWTCQVCGEVSKPLTVHHGLYRFGVEPWNYPESTLWCLCTDCHESAQNLLTDLKVDLGKIPPSAYVEVESAIATIRKKYVHMGRQHG